jgi:hypothetical protein
VSIALDYTRRINPAALRAAGVSDVCRYLSWPNYWGGQTHAGLNPKIIQKPEYDELIGAGIGVTLNWEYDSRDWLGGTEAGGAHAVEAVRQARALGYLTGATIVGSADFDMSRAQWNSAGRAYAVAFAHGVAGGGYRPGVYGPYDVLTWCKTETVIDRFWQCMSTGFSGGRNGWPWPGAHLRQRGYQTVGTVQGDRNEILIPDWGQARKDMDMALSTADVELILNAFVYAPDPAHPDQRKTVREILADCQAILLAGHTMGGPLTDSYVLRQLKEIDDKASVPTVTLTTEQVQALGQVLAAALPNALRVALEGLTLHTD